jgi:hypothetical protein
MLSEKGQAKRYRYYAVTWNQVGVMFVSLARERITHAHLKRPERTPRWLCWSGTVGDRHSKLKKNRVSDIFAQLVERGSRLPLFKLGAILALNGHVRWYLRMPSRYSVRAMFFVCQVQYRMVLCTRVG